MFSSQERKLLSLISQNSSADDAAAIKAAADTSENSNAVEIVSPGSGSNKIAPAVDMKSSISQQIAVMSRKSQSSATATVAASSSLIASSSNNNTTGGINLNAFDAGGFLADLRAKLANLNPTKSKPTRFADLRIPAPANPFIRDDGTARSLQSPVIVIIRHGKTEHNKLGLFTGWEDAPLAAEGTLAHGHNQNHLSLS
jgi:Histidine phosphatase superfamily (branch 1)